MKAVKQGNLEIVATVKDSKKVNVNDFDLAIISGKNDFYSRMKLLEAQGFPSNRINRVFKTPNLNLPRLINEGIAYGFSQIPLNDNSTTIYPHVYRFVKNNSVFKLGNKSYIVQALIEEHHCINPLEIFHHWHGT